jgi:hypothetical protein
MRISAAFHHDSRRDKPSSDTTRDAMRKISFRPTSRRSSHPQQGQHRPAPRRTQRDIRPGGIGFRHLQLVDLGFPAAAAGLADLARAGLLTGVSQAAYGDGLTGLARVAPLGEVPGVSKFVEVHVLDVVTRGQSAVLALRWQATGPGGGLFPALDADIWLTPAGSILPGCRRPGSTGLRSVPWARAWTGRSFTGWPTRRHGPYWPASLTFSPAPGAWPSPCRRPAQEAAPSAGPARNALARLPAAGRIRLMVIEYDVPDVPDRQIQLAEGFPDLARGPALAVEQPQSRFQDQSRRDNPVDHDIVQGPGDAVAILHQEQDPLGRVTYAPGQGTVRWLHARLIRFRYRAITCSW